MSEKFSVQVQGTLDSVQRQQIASIFGVAEFVELLISGNEFSLRFDTDIMPSDHHPAKLTSGETQGSAVAESAPIHASKLTSGEVQSSGMQSTEPPKKVTLSELRAAARKFIEANGGIPAGQELFRTKHLHPRGAKILNDLKEEQYAEIVAELS